MYSRRPARSSQSQIQNLSGYLATRQTPRGAISLRRAGLRGLGKALPECEHAAPPAGCNYVTSADNPCGTLVCDSRSSRTSRGDVDANLTTITTNPVPLPPVVNQVTTYNPAPSNYVAPPATSLPPAVATTAATTPATSAFDLSAVPWWGWAIAAGVGYYALSGNSAPKRARRYY